MFGSITIARIKGIPVKIDFTWVPLFIIITTTLGMELNRYIENIDTYRLIFWTILGSLTFFFCLLLHEMAHALVALREKIGVKSVTLFLFGAVAQLTKEPETPGAEFRMAAAGPAVSILLGIIFMGLWHVFIKYNFPVVIILLAQVLGITNIILAAFNLVPAFPLDGGRIFRAAAWAITKDLKKSTSIAVTLGKGFVIVLGLWGVTDFFAKDWLTGFWKIIIAFFLYKAADSSLRMLNVKRAISGIRVADIMTSPPVTVPPDITISELVYDFFLSHQILAYPVAENNRPLGIVSADEIRKIPRELWENTTVRQVMKPVTDNMLISSEDDMERAFVRLNEEDLERLLVLYEGKLAGILSRTDVSRFIEIRKRLDESGRQIIEINRYDPRFKA